MKLNSNIEEFRRSKLKYIVKILSGWDNRKFKNKYLKKMEVSFSRGEILKKE